MKKFKNIFALLVIALVGLSLTACSDDDNLNTNQYGGDITLTAFGPCPVLRGGTLYFYGKNLDQITEIDLPGSDPITAIEVIEKGTHSVIAIQVPAEGGEVGPVTLVTPKGGTIVSTSSITFREDIKIEDVYIGEEGNLTGSVGDIVTIKGDYLNLLNAVIFTEKDTVLAEDFISQDRYTIQVPINAFASSGTLTLSDLAETPTDIVTEQAIVVNLPEAGTITPNPAKAGSTITINGESMDQIESVVLQGVIVPEEEIGHSTDGKSIFFKLPEEAKDGEVTLVTYSGVKISAGNITTVAPSNLAVVGTPKNGLKMEITGQDLELVKTVALENAGDVAADKVTITSSKITISEVPEAAQDGDATLTMANGKQVTVAYTLVKPTVTESDPAAFVAGEEIVLYGTDLDLVASITFPGDGAPTVTAENFAAQQEEGIQVTTPAAAAGSGLTLNLKNGQKVTFDGIFNIQAATDPAVAGDVTGTIGKEVTVNGKNFYNVESVYIGETKITKFKNRTDNTMTFVIPETIASGTYDFIMVSPEGTSYKVSKFIVVSPEKIFWEGEVSTMGEWKNIEGIGSDGGAELKAIDPQPGWVIRIYCDFSAGWQLKFLEGHWGPMYIGAADPEAASPADGMPAYDLDANGGCIVVPITQGMLDAAYTTQWWGGTFILQGQNYVLKKITVAEK